MAIYDTMQYIKCDVSTICVGMAASMGAFLLAAGAKGKRMALPNAEIMIHQPSGGAQGQATDIAIHGGAYRQDQEEAEPTFWQRAPASRWKRLRADAERDHYMIAEEAKAYGLIDEVIIIAKVRGK